MAHWLALQWFLLQSLSIRKSYAKNVFFHLLFCGFLLYSQPQFMLSKPLHTMKSIVKQFCILILLSCTLRLSMVVATMFHEFCHVVCATSIGCSREKTSLKSFQIYHTTLQTWLQCLNPMESIPTDFFPFVSFTHPEGMDSTIIRDRETLISRSGWMGSALLTVTVFRCLQSLHYHSTSPELSLLLSQVAMGTLYTLLSTVSSDVFEMIPESVKLPNAHFCGNFGLLVVKGGAKLKRSVVDAMLVLESMASISTQRGGQSGGLVTLLRKPNGDVHGVRVRVCPSKRQSLSSLLRSSFQWRLFVAALWDNVKSIFWFFLPRIPPPHSAEFGIYIGHSRFATSSIPSSSETHPHRWSPERNFTFWKAGDPLSHGRSFSNTTTGVYITHNGDFEFWNLFGRDRTHEEMGLWLAAILGRPASALCDSAMIAGLIELLRTQGLWLHSFRLAFQQVIVESYEEVVNPQPDAPISAPSQSSLLSLSAMAEQVLQDFLKSHKVSTAESRVGFRSLLSNDDILTLENTLHATIRLVATSKKVAGRFQAAHQIVFDLPETSLRQLVRQAVTNFLDNDLYWAVKKFLSHAKGSFGMAASCTLDPDRVVLAARNQPLSIGLATSQLAVLYSSESQSLKVPLSSTESSGNHVKYRLDLDEDKGEIVEMVLGEGGQVSGSDWTGNEDVESGDSVEEGFVLQEAPFVRFRMHNQKENRALTADDIRLAGRLVNLEDNHYICPMALKKQKDVVKSDIQDIPRVLSAIRHHWATESSLNCQAAESMFEMLAEKSQSRAQNGFDEAKNRREIDVLVVGVENSLWIGEQFAADLQNLLPQLRVVPISSNKVIGVLGNARGAISTAGCSFGRISTLLTPTSVVIAISQSGQTFPTLHATRILAKHCPGRVFVCAGMVDSKMGSAVGQSIAMDASFSRRVIHTLAEWREAEPATVSAVACHVTLTELMLYLANKLRLATNLGSYPLGLRLSAIDISDLKRIRDASIEEGIVAITGSSTQGTPVDSDVHRQLVNQGHKWALHVLETPLAWFLSSLYIFVTVILGVPIFTDVRRWLQLDGRAIVYVAHALDSLVYCFLPLIFALILRLITGRQLLPRIGMRTIVIADIPYVHQLLEIYVSKLFSLSYWIATVEVHGSNPIDHFVHRFTHRVKRGLLLAVGRPDGRLCSQTKCESWVLMSVMQARSIISLNTGAEAITIGHNPHSNKVIHRHITLPSHRPHFLCEKLLGVDEVEPMKRLASRKHVVQKSNGPSSFVDVDSHVVGSHLCMEGTLRDARRISLRMMAGGRTEIDEEEMDDPHSRSIVLSAMAGDMQRLLEMQSALEEFTENRFLSLERLISFHVMFHAMAARVSSLWPLKFDTWRSQSCLRIATTAAPVSASDLEREWRDSLEDRDREVTVHPRGGGSNRGGAMSRIQSHLSITELLRVGESHRGGVSHNGGLSPGSSLRRAGGGGVMGFLSPKWGSDGSRMEGSSHHKKRSQVHGESGAAGGGGGSVKGGSHGRGGMEGVEYVEYVNSGRKGSHEESEEFKRRNEVQVEEEVLSGRTFNDGRVKGAREMLQILGSSSAGVN